MRDSQQLIDAADEVSPRLGALMRTQCGVEQPANAALPARLRARVAPTSETLTYVDAQPSVPKLPVADSLVSTPEAPCLATMDDDGDRCDCDTDSPKCSGMHRVAATATEVRAKRHAEHVSRERLDDFPSWGDQMNEQAAIRKDRYDIAAQATRAQVTHRNNVIAKAAREWLASHDIDSEDLDYDAMAVKLMEKLNESMPAGINGAAPQPADPDMKVPITPAFFRSPEHAPKHVNIVRRPCGQDYFTPVADDCAASARGLSANKKSAKPAGAEEPRGKSAGTEDPRGESAGTEEPREETTGEPREETGPGYWNCSDVKPRKFGATPGGCAAANGPNSRPCWFCGKVGACEHGYVPAPVSERESVEDLCTCPCGGCSGETFTCPCDGCSGNATTHPCGGCSGDPIICPGCTGSSPVHIVGPNCELGFDAPQGPGFTVRGEIGPAGVTRLAGGTRLADCDGECNWGAGDAVKWWPRPPATGWGVAGGDDHTICAPTRHQLRQRFGALHGAFPIDAYPTPNSIDAYPTPAPIGAYRAYRPPVKSKLATLWHVVAGVSGGTCALLVALFTFAATLVGESYYVGWMGGLYAELESGTVARALVALAAAAPVYALVAGPMIAALALLEFSETGGLMRGLVADYGGNRWSFGRMYAILAAAGVSIAAGLVPACAWAAFIFSQFGDAYPLAVALGIDAIFLGACGVAFIGSLAASFCTY